MITKNNFQQCQYIFQLLRLKISARKRRLFILANLRYLQKYLTPNDSHIPEILEIGELFADGKMTKKDITKLRKQIKHFAYRTYDANYVYESLLNHSAIAGSIVLATDLPRYMFADSFDKHGDFLEAKQAQLKFFKEIVNPYVKPIDPTILNWKDQTLVKMAEKAYNDKSFSVMPIIADALEEAGCQDVEILSHCRNDQQHVKGCWVVDLILGKG